MKYKGLIFKFLFLFILLIISKNINAQDLKPYLFIQYDDNEICELKLSKDFFLENQCGVLNISGGSLVNPITIPLNSISLIGFLYKEADSDEASLDFLKDNQFDDLWQIYDIEGRLIRETRSNNPDLKNLPVRNIYIIKNGSSSFKYVPYK